MSENRGMTTGTEGIGGLLPEDYGDLIVQPVQAKSVAYQVSTNITTKDYEFHIPVVTEDTTAAWVGEGEEIPSSEESFAEETVVPKAVAALTAVSEELAYDSSPGAMELVGQSMTRSVVKAVDAAYFGNTTDKGPSGLEAVTDVNQVAAPSEWKDLDPFAQAISEAEIVGATLTAFVAHPADALALATLKDEKDSSRPLLGVDPTFPTRRLIQGVPLFVSPAVTEDTVWGIPKDLAIIVTRDDVKVQRNDTVYFTSRRIGLRAVMRVGFSWPHPKAIQKITLTP